ncbi:MAG TPA: hypothetical protein PLQ35_18000 [bacterium]|nr:hypothetical protein [bacterium]
MHVHNPPKSIIGRVFLATGLCLVSVIIVVILSTQLQDMILNVLSVMKGKQIQDHWPWKLQGYLWKSVLLGFLFISVAILMDRTYRVSLATSLSKWETLIRITVTWLLRVCASCLLVVVLLRGRYTAISLVVTLLGFSIFGLMMLSASRVRCLQFSTLLTLIMVIGIAFSVRFCEILFTPEGNNFIDLSIYISGGELLSADINPYDWDEDPTTREQLRVSNFSFNGFTSRTQERWNYYASSNLPLTLVFLGLADRLSSSPMSYRLLFAAMDSALAGLTVLFIVRFWPCDLSLRKIVIYALALAGLSPVLFQYGVRLPEDKGIQILLMLLSLYFAGSAKKIYLSALFLGASVAFKGIGLIMLPLALYYALGRPGYFRVRQDVYHASLYISIATIGCLIWFIPFIPDVFAKMSDRFISNVGSSNMPGQGSPFVIIANYFPETWSDIRYLLVFMFLGTTGVGLVRRRLSLEMVTAVLFAVFVLMMLTGGSMDRMNMAIMTSIIIIGVSNYPISRMLTIFYFFGYIPVLLLGDRGQKYSQWYTLIYLLLFIGSIFVIILRRNRDVGRVKYNQAVPFGK